MRYSISLRRYRRTRGLKQSEVAKRMGLCDSSLISRWETGFSLPDLENAIKLADIYDLTVDELFRDLFGADNKRGRVKMYGKIKTTSSETKG